MRRYFTKKYLIIYIIIAILAYGGYRYFGDSEVKKQETIKASRTTLEQEVSVTGKVKAADGVDLAFQVGGKINSIYVDVGSRVKAGSLLAILDSSGIVADIEKSRASLQVEKTKLIQLKQGTREEEIQIQEAKVKSAISAKEDAERNLYDKIADSYTKADDAIRNRVDQFFNNSRTNNPTLTFSIEASTKNNLEFGRVLIESRLTEWQSGIARGYSNSDISKSAEIAKENINSINNYLNDIAFAVNSLKQTSSLSQTTIDGYRSDISTARTNVNTAATNLSAADEKLRSAKSSLLVAENELLLKKAGSTKEEIATQEAKVAEAEASIQKYETELAKTRIPAPISGVIIKKSSEVGEIVAANTVIMSLVSESKFEIEANVPEGDIAKVKLGDSAHITLDAFGSDRTFKAGVVFIEPAETVIDGVATYKITLQFTSDDSGVKPGMTANIDIFTDKREEVIAIPQRAIVTKNGNKIVRVAESDGSVREIIVKTGLRGTNGNIEIIEGLSGGENVIVFFEEN